MPRLRFVLVFSVLHACGSAAVPARPGDPANREPTVSSNGPPSSKSLYERLGGEAAIKLVVEEFVGLTTTDARIKYRFANTDAVVLKRRLVEFVCVATGGPCQYRGRDMAAAHAGMELVAAEFTALAEDLAAALDKYKVPAREKSELMGAVAGLESQIVVPEGKLKPIDEAKLEATVKLAARLQDKEAADLLAAAAIAGRRGQRSYAEQLFARAELIVGPQALAEIAPTFRAGAPPLLTTALGKFPMDTPPQPKTSAGSSEEGEPAAKREPASLNGVITVQGMPVNGLGVVMMRPVGGRARKRSPKAAIVEQRDKQFAPRVTAVSVGSTVTFPNFDPIFHNVFSLSKAKAFDLGMYKSGDARTVTFDKPGLIRLGCNIHADMAAYVIVVADPHYAVVDRDGRFNFRVLEPGRYVVTAWSESGGEPTTKTMTIKRGVNRTSIDLAAGAAPTVGPDKFGEPRAAAP